MNDALWFSLPSLRRHSPLSMSCRSPSLSDMPLGSAAGRKSTSHRYICTKVLLAEGGDTPFTEHCRNYENSYRVSDMITMTTTMGRVTWPLHL